MTSILNLKSLKKYGSVQNMSFRELQKLSKKKFQRNFCIVSGSRNIKKIHQMKDKIKCNKTLYIFIQKIIFNISKIAADIFQGKYRNFTRKISAVILQKLNFKLFIENIRRFIAFDLIFHLVYLF